MSKKTKNNLNDFITGTATQWQRQVEYYHNNKRKIKRAQRFALDLMDYMDAHNIKQKDLAEKMGVSPQQVNKILRAKSNLTFETLDKIEDALGVTISNPKIKEQSKVYFQTTGKTMQVVHRTTNKVMETNLSSTSVTKKNPLLDTTIASMDDYKYTAGKI